MVAISIMEGGGKGESGGGGTETWKEKRKKAIAHVKRPHSNWGAVGDANTRMQLGVIAASTEAMLRKSGWVRRRGRVEERE